MACLDLFYEKGILEVCTAIREPTNRFRGLNSYIYGIVSFHDGDIKVPGRLTDLILDEEDIEPSALEGKEVVPRIRRRYAVERSEIVPTISLAFTLADEYYPYQRFEPKEPREKAEKPGIVGYGVYTSRFRIKEEGLERTVPFIDEDAITASVEAGKLALIHAGVDPHLVKKVYVGSESNPYAVKPIASKVAQVLELGVKLPGELQEVDAIDTQFACKAATSMFKDAAALAYYPFVETPYVMVIGADNAQAAPRNTAGGELDFFVGYGASAFIFGLYDVIAEVEAWYSCTSDTPDFWRRDTQEYPRHGGRFTGAPAYFKHVEKAAKGLMDKFGYKPSDFDYFVLHQPNPTFPVKAARSLGFKEEQYSLGLKVSKFGNTYSSSSPLGLAAVLDKAKPHQRILLVSYGSGAGSDAYVFITTPLIETKRERQKFTVEWQAENKFLKYVDYATYRRFKAGLELSS
ncbi:MAG: hydroxymethylglutaryl-CoA synthase [Thermoprotei archaeon]|nr:MAG: hydroxymethylglutaryl-CoA synthase [Thermoprotei archaeon]RLF17995.1 MAG: hydroxymethylglutaryl-CoA synthase [Thermoprotei archaeon]